MKVIIIFCFFLLLVLCSAFTGNVIFKKMKSGINNIIENSNPGTQCASDMKTFISDLYNFKSWALKMFDASSKIQPGILNGNLFQFGHYDECMAVRKKHEGRLIEGQYCTGVLIPHHNSSRSNLLTDLGLRRKGHDISTFVKYAVISIGICVPKSCSVKHVQRMWDYAENKYKLPLHVFFEEDLCVYEGKLIESYSIDFYVFLFFGIVLVMVVSSTIYDIHSQRHDQKAGIFVIFSLYTNAKKLFATNCDNTLSCLYGIKVLSMMWITFGHIWLANSVTPKTNTIQYFLEMKDSFRSSFVLAATFAVDTFFSVSGILVAYLQMKYSEKIRISLFAFYSHRFIRLSPAILAGILFYISVIKYLSEGPFWHAVVKKVSENCYSNGWGTLFFYTNHIPRPDQCMGETWYLAIDTQLYCLSPLIFTYIKKYPRRVMAGIAAACFITTVHNFTVTIRKNLAATFIDVDENYYEYFFHSTLSRMPPWLIGIFCGFLLYHNNRNKKIMISRKSNFILLTLSLCLMLGIVLYHITLTKYDYNVYCAALHNAFARPLWSLAVCYIIFSCSTGRGATKLPGISPKRNNYNSDKRPDYIELHSVDKSFRLKFRSRIPGPIFETLSLLIASLLSVRNLYHPSLDDRGFINTFLSHPVFIVLGKLTYSMYLVQLGVLMVLGGHQRQGGHLSYLEVFLEFWGDCVIILVCSAIMCLIFEIPILSLMKYLAERKLDTRNTIIYYRQSISVDTQENNKSNLMTL